MNENERINEVIRRLVNIYNFTKERIYEKEYKNIRPFIEGEAGAYLHTLNIIAEEFEIEICVKEEK